MFSNPFSTCTLDALLIKRQPMGIGLNCPRSDRIVSFFFFFQNKRTNTLTVCAPREAENEAGSWQFICILRYFVILLRKISPSTLSAILCSKV